MVEILDYEVDTSKIPSISSARLIKVEGTGALKEKHTKVEKKLYDPQFHSQVCLNDIPLIQVNSPECPTCQSLIATGYGIEKANSKELKQISEKLNKPFISIEKSIEDMLPLLSLMESGFYVIADAICYPTDDTGKFFWNVSDRFTYHQGTTSVCVPEADYEYICGQPVYLYPTQDTDCYNEERVQYYVNMFKKEEEQPRSIAYNFTDFISFIIDGHHKTCAAALLKQPVKCILIIPCTAAIYENKKGIPNIIESLYFPNIEIMMKDLPKEYTEFTYLGKDKETFKLSRGKICHRDWNGEYGKVSYPDVQKYAEMLAFQVPYLEKITDEDISKLQEADDEYTNHKITAVLSLMEQARDLRLKETAMRFIETSTCREVKVASYHALSKIQDDPQIEELFIEYLVNNSDEHDDIIKIIDSYWE